MVTEEMIKQICKDYSSSRRSIFLAEKSLNMYNRKVAEAKTDSEKNIYRYAIDRREREIEESNHKIEVFERIAHQLPEDELWVMEQIYGKNKKWGEVPDKEGGIIPKSKVTTIWKRAIRHMKYYLCEDT